MVAVPLLLIILALVFALLAAFNAPGSARVSWLGLALALFIASFIVRGA